MYMIEVNDVMDHERIMKEDKNSWTIKMPFFDYGGERINCPTGMHYVKGYPSKTGYVKGSCCKNPKKRFILF